MRLKADRETITRYAGLIYLPILIGSVLYGFLLSLAWPLYHDETIIQYIAWRILNGAAPYRDIFEMNMPGAYVLRVFSLVFFGESDLGYRLFDLYFVLLIALGIFAFCGRALLYPAIGALLYFAYHLSWGPRTMGECDMMVIPFLMGALYVFREYLERPERVGLMFVFGLCAGYAPWVKPVAVMLPVMCYLAMAVRLGINKQTMIAGVYGVLGYLVPGVLLNLWLFTNGGLAAFYDITLHFIVIYKNFKPLPWTLETWVSLAFNLYCVGTMLVVMARRSTLNATGRIVLAIGLVYGLLHYYVQGKGFWYHREPLRVFMCLYAAMVLPRLNSKPFELGLIHLAFFSLVIYFSPLEELQDAKINNYRKVFSVDMRKGIANDVNGALAKVPVPIRKAYNAQYPGRDIQFFGLPDNEMWNTAFHEHWVPPTRFIYPYGLYNGQGYLAQIAQELFDGLSMMKPPVILIPSQSWPYDVPVTYRTIDTVEPWKGFFKDYYHVSKETPAYRIYIRTH